MDSGDGYGTLQQGNTKNIIAIQNWVYVMVQQKLQSESGKEV